MGAIILTSQSKIKLDAVKKFFNLEYSELLTYSTSKADLPNQPVNSALECSKMRIQYIKDNYDLPKEYRFIVSIENGLKVSKGMDNKEVVEDICYVTIEDRFGNQHYGWSESVIVPTEFYGQAKEKSQSIDTNHELGIYVTVGELIGKKHKVPADNWMGFFKDNGPNSREEQIFDALNKINDFNYN